jgi:hypothetical protein
MTPFSDLPLSTLFLFFLMLFLLIGNSPALHRWLDRITGMARREGGSETEKEPEEEAEEAPMGMNDRMKGFEAIIFQQLALAGEKGLSPASLAGALHFDRPAVEEALAALETQGMIQRGGLLGRRFHLSPKGRERAVQEGIIPQTRTGDIL